MLCRFIWAGKWGKIESLFWGMVTLHLKYQYNGIHAMQLWECVKKNQITHSQHDQFGWNLLGLFSLDTHFSRSHILFFICPSFHTLHKENGRIWPSATTNVYGGIRSKFHWKKYWNQGKFSGMQFNLFYTGACYREDECGKEKRNREGEREK